MITLDYSKDALEALKARIRYLGMEGVRWRKKITREPGSGDCLDPIAWDIAKGLTPVQAQVVGKLLSAAIVKALDPDAMERHPQASIMTNTKTGKFTLELQRNAPMPDFDVVASLLAKDIPTVLANADLWKRTTGKRNQGFSIEYSLEDHGFDPRELVKEIAVLLFGAEAQVEYIHHGKSMTEAEHEQHQRAAMRSFIEDGGKLADSGTVRLSLDEDTAMGLFAVLGVDESKIKTPKALGR